MQALRRYAQGGGGHGGALLGLFGLIIGMITRTALGHTGRMLVAGLSNTKDNGGVTGMALYNNAGQVIAKHRFSDGQVIRTSTSLGT